MAKKKLCKGCEDIIYDEEKWCTGEYCTACMLNDSPEQIAARKIRVRESNEWWEKAMKEQFPSQGKS